MGVGAYCYLQVRFALYRYWTLLLMATILLFPPLILIEVIVTSFVVSKFYEECEIPSRWFGLDSKTLADLKDQAFH